MPMWEHDAFGRVGAMATPFGLPASASYGQGSLQVALSSVSCRTQDACCIVPSCQHRLAGVPAAAVSVVVTGRSRGTVAISGWQAVSLAAFSG